MNEIKKKINWNYLDKHTALNEDRNIIAVLIFLLCQPDVLRNIFHLSSQTTKKQNKTAASAFMREKSSGRNSVSGCQKPFRHFLFVTRCQLQPAGRGRTCPREISDETVIHVKFNTLRLSGLQDWRADERPAAHGGETLQWIPHVAQNGESGSAQNCSVHFQTWDPVRIFSSAMGFFPLDANVTFQIKVKILTNWFKLHMHFFLNVIFQYNFN